MKDNDHGGSDDISHPPKESTPSPTPSQGWRWKTDHEDGLDRKSILLATHTEDAIAIQGGWATAALTVSTPIMHCTDDTGLEDERQVPAPGSVRSTGVKEYEGACLKNALVDHQHQGSPVDGARGLSLKDGAKAAVVPPVTGSENYIPGKSIKI